MYWRKHASSLCHIGQIQQDIIKCDTFVMERLSRDLVQSFYFIKIADDERRVRHGGHHVPSSPNPLSTSKGI